MLIKDVEECKEIIAEDRSILKELLSPLKDDVAITYSIAYAKVKPGKTTRLHRLKATEIYYILHGKGEMRINDEVMEIRKNQLIYIPPNAIQQIRNIGKDDLIFLCIVEPAWKPENEEILEE